MGFLGQISVKIIDTKTVEIKNPKTPWYKRPLRYEEFSFKKNASDDYYIRHNEWSPRVWIGPYKSTSEVHDIINSYVVASLKLPLDKIKNTNIHSVVIEDEKTFFKIQARKGNL